jgi:hypothetical protein
MREMRHFALLAFVAAIATVPLAEARRKAAPAPSPLTALELSLRDGQGLSVFLVQREADGHRLAYRAADGDKQEIELSQEDAESLFAKATAEPFAQPSDDPKGCPVDQGVVRLIFRDKREEKHVGCMSANSRNARKIRQIIGLLAELVR